MLGIRVLKKDALKQRSSGRLFEPFRCRRILSEIKRLKPLLENLPQEQLGPLLLRVGEEMFRSPFFDQFALVHK